MLFFLLITSFGGGFSAPVELDDAAGFYVRAGDIITGGCDDFLLLDISQDAYIHFGANPAVSWTWNAADGGTGELGDFDGDGHLDIAVSENSSARVTYHVGDWGWPDYNGTERYRNTGYFNSFAVGDLNGDGRDDMVVRSNHDVFTSYLGAASGAFSTRASVTVSGWENYNFTLADVDNDGDDDLIALVRSNGNTIINARLNDGSGRFSGLRTTTSHNVMAGWQATGDLNNDGREDLVFGFQSGIVRYLAHPTDKGRFYSPSYRGTGGSVRFARLLDVDGDGDLSLVIGVDDAVWLYRFNSNGSFQSSVLLTDAINLPTDAAAGDFDCDGVTDIIIVNNVTANILYGFNLVPIPWP